METLDDWIGRQYAHSAVALMRSVSAVHLVKVRAGFAQTVVPCRGSIVASPVFAAYDPEPDYFFHWYRDSAIVMDAIRLLSMDSDSGIAGQQHFADFMRFNLALQELDGRRLVIDPVRRNAVLPGYRQYLRSDADLAHVHGPAIAAEARVNPDGSLDLSQWSRPQNDGPALRALCVLRWLEDFPPDAEMDAAAGRLLRADLSFTLEHWRAPCFDIWEEESGAHYYTLRVAAAALEAGAGWFERQGERSVAIKCRADARKITSELDGYWLEDAGFYRSRILESRRRSTKELDIAVILAALHAGGAGSRAGSSAGSSAVSGARSGAGSGSGSAACSGPAAHADAGAAHSVRDPRMHATLAQLEAYFATEYAINQNRPSSRAPAMGRYPNDVYFSGGAYYFATLAAAEFCFRAAQDAPNGTSLAAHGDAFLETVRTFVPQNGEMSEQFDQADGKPRSAQQLAWSYAAFISCIEARRRLTVPRGD
jgi:glucoamylase